MTIAALCRLAAIVFTAVTIIVIGDTAGTILSRQGVDPTLVAWSRFVLAAAVLLPFSGLSISELKYLKDWRVLIRGAFITGGIFCILTALKTEPMANVFGAFFIGPIVSYVLAIVFLGEKPSWQRTALLALGFFGVMLVVKPGFGASWGLLLALIAGTCHGSYLAVTRATAGSYRPRFLLISQLLVGSILLTPLGLTVGIPELNLSVVALICLSAFSSAIGNYMLVIANKTAEASLIAPLVYGQLISATVIGTLVFSEWPDGLTIVGLSLIIVSGFGSLVMHRLKTQAT